MTVRTDFSQPSIAGGELLMLSVYASPEEAAEALCEDAAAAAMELGKIAVAINCEE